VTNLAILRRKLESAVNAQSARDRRYLEKRQAQRNHFIDRCYEVGGQDFVDRVKKYGCTEKGDKLRLPTWYEEYLLAIGDFRLSHVLTTGPAQNGKTMGHTLLMADCLTTGKLNSAWFYDSRTNLDQNVPMQFHPVMEFWIAHMQEDGIRFRRGRDRTINTRYQVDQANAIFSYVSTSRPSIRDMGRAAAGGAAVSFQADWMVLEERSQYPPGAADPLPRRLDASMLPSRPIRELGTPGGGQGIEAALEDCDRYFYPHYECEQCHQVQPLDPKGCLLIPTTVRDALGRPKTSYLSESGRPIHWFHSDDHHPIDSAYFGCAYCGHAIADEQRYSAEFRCRQTGERLRDFLDSLPAGVPEKNWKVAVHLSPLTRETRTNLAAEIIQSGLDASTTEDWQQQRLGHPSETQAASITMSMLREAMTAPKPERKPDYTLAGVDVGRSEDWFIAIDFFLPQGWQRMKPAEIMEKTIRSVRFASGIVRDRIPKLLKEYSVAYGLIDNEPSRESSMRICRGTVLEMADQIAYLDDIAVEGVVEDGGMEARCWMIRNEKFMGQVLEGFLLKAPDGYPLYRLPIDWERWIGNPSENSPLRHLSGPYRDPDGQWRRGKGNVDDLYFATVFVEAAFYIKLLKPRRYYGGASAGDRPVGKVLDDL
jgi:hypothetical protein